MDEKCNWIIGICNSGSDGVMIKRVCGTKEEVKRFFFSLVMEERASESECFDYGTDSIDDITIGIDGSLYAFNCFFESHTDYSLWTETEPVPVGGSDCGNGMQGLSMVAYKVYGPGGHGQSEALQPSYWYDFSNKQGKRIIEVFNSDLTGTADYSVIRVFMESYSQCIVEVKGQITDGVFEDCAVGHYEDATSEYALDNVPRMAAERRAD